MPNLNYAITLTGMVTNQFNDVRNAVESLREFVSKGAEFPITVDANFTAKLKTHIQSALRDGLKEGVGGGASAADSASGTELRENVQYLTTAVETLTGDLRKFVAALNKPPGGSPSTTQTAGARSYSALRKDFDESFGGSDARAGLDYTKDQLKNKIDKLVQEVGAEGAELLRATQKESQRAKEDVAQLAARVSGILASLEAGGQSRTLPPASTIRAQAERDSLRPFGDTPDAVETFARLVGARIGEVLKTYLSTLPSFTDSPEHTGKGNASRRRKDPVTVDEVNENISASQSKGSAGPQYTRPADFGADDPTGIPGTVVVASQKQNAKGTDQSKVALLRRAKDLAYAESALVNQDIVAVDFETDKVTKQIRTLQVSLGKAVDGVKTLVFDFKHLKLDEMDRIFKALGDDRLTKVGHNLSFEQRRLMESLGLSFGTNLHDTQLVDRALRTGEAVAKGTRPRPSGHIPIGSEKGNFAAVAQRMLGVTVAGKGTTQTSFTMEDELTQEQLQYAVLDTLYALQVAEAQRAKLKTQSDPKVRAAVQHFMERHGALIPHIAQNVPEENQHEFFSLIDEALARTVYRGEDFSSVMARFTDKAPGLSVRGMANLNSAVEQNMQSPQVMAYMRGLAWYKQQSLGTQNAAALLGANQFMAIPGMSSVATMDALSAMIANPPTSLFSHVDNADNPAIAQRQFVEQLKNDRRRLEEMLQNPVLAGRIAYGNVGGFSFTGGSAIMRMLDTLNALEKNPSRTLEQDTARDAIAKDLESIGVLSAFGVTPQEQAENIRGPRHFASIEAPRYVSTMHFAGGLTRNDGYGLSPVVLQRLQQGVGGTYTPDELKGLEQGMGEWAQSQGLTFYRQSANRQQAMQRYMETQMKLLLSLKRGELPEDMLPMLARVTEQRPDFLQYDARLLEDYERRMAAGEISATSASKKIDRSAYQEIEKAIETRLQFAYAEQMQGGVWSLPGGQFALRRGAFVPGMGAMLLTSQEYNRGRLLVDPSQIAFGSTMPDMSPEVLGAMFGHRQAYNTPGGLTPQQEHTLRTLQQHADVQGRLRPHASDPTLMVDPVTNETFKRASSLGGTLTGDYRVSTAVGTGFDVFARDVLGGQPLKAWNEYQTEMNGKSFPLFKTEELFKQQVQAFTEWKNKMTADGSILLTDNLRFTRPAGPGEAHGLTGAMDITRIRPDGTSDIIDLKTGSYWQSAEGQKKYGLQLGAYASIFEHLGLPVGELAILPFLTKFMGKNPTGTPTLTEATMHDMLSLGFGKGMAGGVGGGGVFGGGVVFPGGTLPGGGPLPVKVMNFAELPGVFATSPAVANATAVASTSTPVAPGTKLTGVLATKDLAETLSANRRVDTAQKLADIDIQKRRRVLELRREFSAATDAEIDRLLKLSAASVIAENDSDMLPFTRSTPAESYKTDQVLFGRDTKKLLSALMTADNARSVLEANMVLQSGNPDALRRLYPQYLSAETKTDVGQLRLIELLRAGDLTAASQAMNEPMLAEKLSAAAEQGRLGIRGMSGLKYLQNIQAAQLALTASHASKTDQLAMAEPLFAALGNSEEQTKLSGAYGAALQRQEGAAKKLKAMQDRLADPNLSDSNVESLRNALLNAKVIDPVTGQFLNSGTGPSVQLGNVLNAIRAAVPGVSNEELTLYLHKLNPDSLEAPIRSGRRALFPNVAEENLTSEQRSQIAAYEDQLRLDFGAASGFNATNAQSFLQAILLHRQMKVTKAEEELNQTTDARQKAESLAGGVTPQQAAEQQKLRQSELFAVLNVKNMTEAQAAIERLKRELLKTAETMGQLSDKSDETLKHMRDLFGQEINDVEQLEQVLSRVMEMFRASGPLAARAAQQVIGNGQQTGDRQGMLGGLFGKMSSLWNYAMAGTVVYGFVNTIKQTAASLVTFEAELKRIQGVLDTRASAAAAQIGAGITQNALDYGVNVQESLRAAKVFAQIGASPQDVVSLSRAALVGQVGAGLEPQQATELLIATRNVTNNRVQPMDILDRISRIEARYAVSAQDLSEGVMRVGSLATQLQPGTMGGVDALDTVIGAVTTIVERTRVSGNQAATALRFMISRLAAPDVSRDLQEKFGIRLAGDSPNQLRPLQDILAEIAEKYQGLLKNNSVQASELLTTFAGARQANVGAALLGNFDRVMSISAESARSFGDAQDRATLQLDTAQAKVAQLNTAFFTMIQRLNEQTGALEAFKGAVSLATTVLKGLTPAAGGDTGRALVGIGTSSATTYMIMRGLSALAGSGMSTSVLGSVNAARVAAGLAGMGTTALGLGAVAGTGALLVGGYRYVNDNELLGLRSYRGTMDVSDDVRRELEQRKNAAAQQFGISGEQLTSNMRTAFQRTVDVFGEERITRMLQLVREKDPNKQLPGEARAFEKEFTEQVRKVIPQFADLGGQVEQLASAMSSLRTAVQEIDLPNSALGRSLNQSREEFMKRIDEEFNSRLLELNRTTADFKGGIRPLSSKEKQQNIISALNSLFAIQGGNLLPGLANMSFVTPDGAQTTGLLSLAEKIKASQKGLPITLSTAVSRAAEQLFGMRQSVRQEFDRALLNSGVTNVAELVGTINQSLGGNATTRSRLVGENDIRGIQNAYRIVTTAERAFAERTRPGAASDKTAAEETAGIDRLYALVQLGMRRAIAKATDANRETLSRTYDNVTRVLQDPRSRNAMLANIQDVSGDMVSIKTRFMTPYFNLMQRQADFSTGMALRDQGFQYDPLAAREAMMRGFAEDMRRVRPEMLRENLTAQIQLGQKTRSEADFGAIVDSLVDSGRTQDDVRNALQTMMPRNQPALTRGELTRQRARVEMQRDYIDRLSSDYAGVFATTPELTERFGSVKEQLQQMLRMLDDGSLERSGEGMNQFRLAAVMVARTLDDATRAAVAFAGAERMNTLKRERERIGIDQALLNRRFALLEEGGEAQRRGNMTVAGFVRTGRLDAAAQTQLQVIGGNIGRVLADRDAQLAAVRSRLEKSDLFGDMTNEGVRLAFENELQKQSQSVNEQSRQQLFQLAEQSAALIDQERNRIKDAREQGFQELLQGGTAGLRELLMDFSKLRGKPLQTLVPAVAQTFQKRLVDNFMDSLIGPMGLFTDKLRAAYLEGGLDTYSKIYSGHIEGMAAAASLLRQAYGVPAGASRIGAGVSGGAGLGISGVAVASGTAALGAGVTWAYRPRTSTTEFSMPIVRNRNVQSSNEQSVYDPVTKTWRVTADRILPVDPVTISPERAAQLLQRAEDARNRIKFNTLLQPKPLTTRERLGRLRDTALPMIGQMGGAYLGSKTGVREGQNYAQEGSSIGATLGMAFGPYGGAVGGLLGGFIGGRFGKGTATDAQYAALEKIERNTRQQVSLLENQTAMMQLDSRFLNAPSGFTIPGYQPFGATSVGGQTTNTVTINVYASANQREDEIANQVATALRNELAGRGTGFDVRTM